MIKQDTFIYELEIADSYVDIEIEYRAIISTVDGGDFETTLISADSVGNSFDAVMVRAGIVLGMYKGIIMDAIDDQVRYN